MDLLKALKRTTYLSAAVLLALGATEASAANQTAILSHISASVQGTLTVKEVSAINFGNFAAAACAVAPTVAAGTPGANYMVLDTKGTRTAVGCITLVYGATGTGLSTTGGANAGTNGFDETGGQSPGFYTIANADGITNVYVSFADINGDIVDSTYGSQGTGSAVYTHPNNVVALSGPAAQAAFVVNEFSFESDDPAGANGASGYTQLHAAAWDAGNSGNYVNCGASCTIRVGAKLTPIVATPTPGKHTGTFYVMVSY